jgi:hypothetical protein
VAVVRRGGEWGRHKRPQQEGRQRPLIVKANYCKRDKDDRNRAKDHIRYITHRRDLEGQKVTRDLFGFDGLLSKDTAYRMVDDAPKKGRYYYRVVISPDPRREDHYKDLSLRNLTIATMLKLEERYGKSIQFVAAIHDDHAPHRHVHALVILNGRRLTREDFAALRDHARNRALTERRYKDRVRRLEYLKERSASYRPPFPYAKCDTTKGQFYARQTPLLSYECPVCGRYQALPASKQGYRCLSDGMRLHRAHPYERSQTRSRSYGLELELTL